MPPFADTIAALATPVGTSALAVVRISGKDTRVIATALGGAALVARRARHADYRDRTGQLIDDVVLTYFAGPRSFTGEDSLEVSCHGNPLIAQKILEDLFCRGCRPAEPGEFTKRAFLNGRMDLSQAEAVMDLIHARSDRALAAANQQLRGSLGSRIAAATDLLLGVLAEVEAYIDFPEEDLPPEDQTILRSKIESIMLIINCLSATSHYGELLREGVKTVIIGGPNVGKSSLLNRMVGKERALVSSEPGTTRDFIEECVVVGPHYLRLIDTAGFNRSPTPIEQLGMEKTLERAAEANLIVLVLDCTDPTPPMLPAALVERLPNVPTVIVLNKVDLATDPRPSFSIRGAPVVTVSALRGLGFDELTRVIVGMVDQTAQDPADLVAINARHSHALSHVRRCLSAARVKLDTGGAIELLASDLRGGLDALGEITGRIDNERVLDRLFATFCIGK